MRRGFTLIEMIVTIVILGILSAGTFVSLQHLYLRSAKSKALSDLSSESQVIVDQIATLMYDRVPSSVIGYDGLSSFESVYELTHTFRVLEWIGVASEAHKVGAYSGFVDMNASIRPTLHVKDLNDTSLPLVLSKKFLGQTFADLGLVFAGSFDDGGSGSIVQSAFGWHGSDANQIYRATIGTNTIQLNDTFPMPMEIYEKYYLVDSAYAVARGSDVNISACNNISVSTDENTLFLFYNYRPWKGKTFCGDKGGANKEGNVTILAKDVSSFEAGVINGVIYLNLGMERKIKGADNNVTISKQKAVY